MNLQYTSSGKLKFNKLSKDDKMEVLRLMFETVLNCAEDTFTLDNLRYCVLGTSIRNLDVGRILNVSRKGGLPVRVKSDPNTRIGRRPECTEDIWYSNIFQEKGLSKFLFSESTEEEEDIYEDGRTVNIPGVCQYYEYTSLQLGLLRILTVADMVNRDESIGPDVKRKTFAKNWRKRFDELVDLSKIEPELVGEDYQEE